MSETIGRITEVIADLNKAVADIGDNDGLEFNLDDRLEAIETQVETLSNEIEETISFAKETSG